MVGVRESWRIRGKYYMDAEDYLKAHHFPDAVCRTAYPIDIHDVKLDLFEKLKKGEPVDMMSEEYRPAIIELQDHPVKVVHNRVP